ncbi:MAG: hypothetical protein JNM51_12030, partial [Bacteroidia bacterium]|nr:hypothetical protein [Bacteroidia bacterium]
MNIAIVTTEFVSENNFDGGLANYTYKLAKFLLQRGHQVTVYLVSKQACEYYFDDIKVIKVQMPDIDWKI